MKRQLGMFAKYWEPGRVKTRLAASIGNDAASGVYQGFVRCLVRRLAGRAERCVVYFTPPERREAFAELVGAAWQLELQGEGDLGARMQRYFDDALRAGYHKVLLIGSDSPTLPAGRIDEAFAALDDAPVVLGPTPDGGYYLVGISECVPPIFQGVAWSTERVWQQTIGRLRDAGCRYAELPPCYDVDEACDLERLRCELANGAAADKALAELAATLDRLLGPSAAAGKND